MTKKEFLIQKSKEAFVEASFLRSEITEEEKKNLDFENFSYSQTSRCIYGLISGNCYNKRSSELIKKSKVKLGFSLDKEIAYDNKEKKLSPSFDFENNQRRNYHFFSPLELFITIDPIDFDEKVLSFIKGEIELEEKDFIEVIHNYFKF